MSDAYQRTFSALDYLSPAELVALVEQITVQLQAHT